MTPTSRRATINDVPDLVRLYRRLEAEQTALKKMWPVADGLAEPVDQSLRSILSDDESVVSIGEIDSVVLGFAWGRREALLPQAGGAMIGSVRLIYTEEEARGVGVGHEMVTLVLDELRSRGVTLFDAYVSPGHRHAKNFFEAHGFSARRIAMHHDDADD